MLVTMEQYFKMAEVARELGKRIGFRPVPGTDKGTIYVSSFVH